MPVAQLVKLVYGLQDLRYMDFGSPSSPHLGNWSPDHQMSVSFFMDLCDFKNDFKKFHDSELTRVPIHVHKMCNRRQFTRCPKEFCTWPMFSIRVVPWGDFELEVNTKIMLDLEMDVCINRKWPCFEHGNTLPLAHGDIIECFYRDLPFHRVMLLLPEEGSVRETQNSPLLSCPVPVLKKIFEYLTPMEAMENVVPVCRQFFELVRHGGIWSNVELKTVLNSRPWVCDVGDFRNVFAEHAKKLAVEFENQEMLRLFLPLENTSSLMKVADWKNLRALEIISWDICNQSVIEFLKNEAFIKLESLTILDWMFPEPFLCEAKDKSLLLPNCQEVTLPCYSLDPDYSVNLRLIFPRLENLHLIYLEEGLYDRGMRFLSSKKFLRFLGSGLLRSLHVERLPVEMDEKAWFRAQDFRTFTSLESLSFHEDLFQKMPVLSGKNALFPALKSLWFRCAKPEGLVQHLLKMPSLQKLWINCAQPKSSPDAKLLHAFDKSPKEWLERLKFVAVDLWETCIPYSKMINLECVGLFFQHEGVSSRSLETVVDELRGCSKLRGLVLHVPEDLPCDALSKLSQRLEFAAFSGANVSCLVSALHFFGEGQINSLEDLWIEIPNLEDFGEILGAVGTFKLLKNVVFVFKMDAYKQPMGPYEDALEKYLGSSSGHQDLSVEQATCTFFFDESFTTFTYNFRLQKETNFLSSSITKFFSNWLKYVTHVDKSSVFALVPAIFPDRHDDVEGSDDELRDSDDEFGDSFDAVHEFGDISGFDDHIKAFLMDF